MTTCYLRIGDDPVEDATRCFSLKEADGDFLCTAKELDRYGQKLGASVHIANSREEVMEYPDYVLSIGPRGGLRKERA